MMGFALSEPRSNVAWVVVACGVFFSLCAAAFLALDGGGGQLAGLFAKRDARPAGLEPMEPAQRPAVDLSPEGLLGADRAGGASEPFQKAQAVLEKAGGQALQVQEQARQAHPEIADFDGKGTVQLKPRTPPRGPLGFLTLTTINPASVTVAEGSDSLGQTPLNNVPVLVGKHAFRLLDNRGVPRRLELEFEHGQTLERLKLDVSRLPPWEP